MWVFFLAELALMARVNATILVDSFILSRGTLQKAKEVVTCTGKLSTWNSVELPDWRIKKVQDSSLQSRSAYDPCAPVDKYVDVPALQTLHKDLED